MNKQLESEKRIILTCISDTHKKHLQITQDLIQGDLIVHAGDVLRKPIGTLSQVFDFIDWFGQLPYKYKVFIGGNHDFSLVDNYDKIQEKVKQYPGMFYLCNDQIILTIKDHQIRIFGSPNSPSREHKRDAFSLDQAELLQNRQQIPQNCDILVTHCQPTGHDSCSLLEKFIRQNSTKIHICGHEHFIYGYGKIKNTHVFRSSVVNFPQYEYENKPINLLWDFSKNQIELIK
uniref:Metallophosphoesterase n=1 Tax=Trepomonas sp. PC1 TaxID=1076344 RepID=A0A146KI12_9EUKA|eukprot:JAP95076.1 Metallophosphoesterase [Trepomonas sp. PC1]